MSESDTFRVMAIHALFYCERLFYLEEVEEIRRADKKVWQGRRLHEELDEDGEIVEISAESPQLGLRGKLDAFRKRDGSLFPVEHKKGKCKRTPDGGKEAWKSDRMQAVAYALLLEQHSGQTVEEARIRYHEDNHTVRLSINEEDKKELSEAIERAAELSSTTDRPPVTEDERKCVHCSLSPVCLPEETRVTKQDEKEESEKPIARLFPPDAERRSLHVVTQGARVRKTGRKLKVSKKEEVLDEIGIRNISDVVLHGFVQITTQAERLCAYENIPVHYITTSGKHLGAFSQKNVAVQRRIRQYEALTDEDLCLVLSKKLVTAKTELQLRHLLRATRDKSSIRDTIQEDISGIRKAISRISNADDRGELRGYEGNVSKFYFSALPRLLTEKIDDRLRPAGRSRRPPKDPFNAILSFGYTMLYRDVLTAIHRVGLEPGFGFFHQPRSSAAPLALDLVEIFRVPIVDMAAIGAVNREQFDYEHDFRIYEEKVWLDDAGRDAFIEAYERRKHTQYKHPVLDYSLSYARMIELEVRLLEKEWSGEPGLFAKLRIR